MEIKQISSIKLVDDSPQTIQSAILKTFYENFINLFIDDYVGDSLLLIVEDHVSKCIPCKIDPSYSTNLDCLLSMEEIHEALYNMALEKKPGIDGLPIKFYRALWPHIHEYFYYVYL